MRLLVARFATLVSFLVVCSCLGSYLSLEELVHNYLGTHTTSLSARGGAVQDNSSIATGLETSSSRNTTDSSAPLALNNTDAIPSRQRDAEEQVQGGTESLHQTQKLTLTPEEPDFNSSTAVNSQICIGENEDTAISQDNDQVERFPSLKKLKLWTPRNSTAVKKRNFLDRIALISNTLLSTEHDAVIDTSPQPHDLNTVTPQSDLTRPGRHMSVVTTAALPWFTGTAVNPLLRAAYLCRTTKRINRNQGQWVTLVIPWLELHDDQMELYGQVFQTEQDQEDYIRTWLADQADMPDVADPDTGLQIMFYPARYHNGLKSIFAMGDVCSLIPHRDVCILEEPEHLNWYRAPGEGWTKKFNYVVGIVHTNYKEYASAHYSGLWTAPAIAALSSAMVRAYCHKVIKLSDVLQTFAPEKEETSNVHGVRSEFLKEGQRRALQLTNQEENNDVATTQVYFIGKILWAKGLDLLLELQSYCRQYTGDYFAIDIYGSGPELEEIKRSYHGRKLYQQKAKKVVGKASKRAKRAKGRRERKRRSLGAPESTIRILGTKIQFGANSDVDNRDKDDIVDNDDISSSEQEDMSEFDSTDSDDVESDAIQEENFNTTQQALDYLQVEARRKLDRLRETIRSTTESMEFDLPKSLNELRRQPIPATFPGRVDHAFIKEQHKIFVNPSVTEVLCTTTAEALAMGKFAIVPVHPSNNFFLKFPNCLAYRNKWEFVTNLKWALAHEPEPLTPELEHEFTWEAATERFINAAAITWGQAQERERLGTSKLDERIAWFHNELGKGIKGDALRKVLGAGPASHQHRYLVEQQQETMEEPTNTLFAEGGEEEDEEEGGGLPHKFRKSSFAKAIRSTVINGLPSMIS